MLLDSWGVKAVDPLLGWREALETAGREAREQHAHALDELRRAVAGAAPVTGRLGHGRGVNVENAATGAGDLLVVDRDDREHRPSFRYRCPLVVVPDQRARP